MAAGASEKHTSRPHWRKSSYSAGDGGECVEVAVTSDTVHVRDSKNPTGPVLTFDHHEWAAFVAFATTD